MESEEVLTGAKRDVEHILRTEIDSNTGDILVKMGGHTYPIDSEFSSEQEPASSSSGTAYHSNVKNEPHDSYQYSEPVQLNIPRIRGTRNHPSGVRCNQSMCQRYEASKPSFTGSFDRQNYMDENSCSYSDSSGTDCRNSHANDKNYEHTHFLNDTGQRFNSHIPGFNVGCPITAQNMETYGNRSYTATDSFYPERKGTNCKTPCTFAYTAPSYNHADTTVSRSAADYHYFNAYYDQAAASHFRSSASCHHSSASLSEVCYSVTETTHDVSIHATGWSANEESCQTPFQHITTDGNRPYNIKKMKRGCRLWEFIRNLLLDPASNPSLIRWENRQEGTFKLIQSKTIAYMWGMKKGNGGMTYEKLSRAMRYYYKRKVFAPVLGKRLVYKFGPRAVGWKE